VLCLPVCCGDVIELVRLLFTTLTIAMRFEPANARFFVTEVQPCLTVVVIELMIAMMTMMMLVIMMMFVGFMAALLSPYFPLYQPCQIVVRLTLVLL